MRIAVIISVFVLITIGFTVCLVGANNTALIKNTDLNNVSMIDSMTYVTNPTLINSTIVVTIYGINLSMANSFGFETTGSLGQTYAELYAVKGDGFYSFYLTNLSSGTSNSNIGCSFSDTAYSALKYFPISYTPYYLNVSLKTDSIQYFTFHESFLNNELYTEKFTSNSTFSITINNVTYNGKTNYDISLYNGSYLYTVTQNNKTETGYLTVYGQSLTYHINVENAINYTKYELMIFIVILLLCVSIPVAISGKHKIDDPVTLLSAVIMGSLVLYTGYYIHLPFITGSTFSFIFFIYAALVARRFFEGDFDSRETVIGAGIIGSMYEFMFSLFDNTQIIGILQYSNFSIALSYSTAITEGKVIFGWMNISGLINIPIGTFFGYLTSPFFYAGNLLSFSFTSIGYIFASIQNSFASLYSPFNYVFAILFGIVEILSIIFSIQIISSRVGGKG